MLQRAMSIPASASKVDEDFINQLLGGNFQVRYIYTFCSLARKRCEGICEV